MARLELTTQELATVAWFLEAAVVSLKEALEEAEEEGVEDAVRARDLYDLEGLREALQGSLGAAPEGTAATPLELTPTQLHRLGRLADDAARLCRGETPHGDLELPSALSEAATLEKTLAGVRDKARAHPEAPGESH
ncbi:MAG TPA: hypothetical protein VKA55_06060 [Gammaproteobacteria bacterium]|nr:hypothetical protein [Gammaproteobacteria bacterium]